MGEGEEVAEGFEHIEVAGDSVCLVLLAELEDRLLERLGLERLVAVDVEDDAGKLEHGRAEQTAAARGDVL